MNLNRNNWCLGVMSAVVMIIVGATTTMAQITSPPPPPTDEQVYQASRTSNAGPYAKGSKRVNIVGGMGSTLGNTYFIVGGGMSYFVADGLAVGLAGEGWILQDPTIWKVSPEIRYTLWKMDRFKPYLGAFYRRTFVGDPFEDFNSWGGRAGVSYRKGGSYVSVGVVHEEFLDCDSNWGDCSTTYPEVSFWFSF